MQIKSVLCQNSRKITFIVLETVMEMQQLALVTWSWLLNRLFGSLVNDNLKITKAQCWQETKKVNLQCKQFCSNSAIFRFLNRLQGLSSGNYFQQTANLYGNRHRVKTIFLQIRTHAKTEKYGKITYQ